MIVPNTAKDLLCHVTTIATGLDYIGAGPILAFIRRESDGNFLKADDSWAVGVPVGADIPHGTLIAHGVWKYNLLAAVTNALTAGDVVSCRMTDNENSALATVTSDVREHGVDVLANSRLAPTVAGRTLDVTATGAAGVDWGNVENKATANALSATTVALSATALGDILDESLVGHDTAQTVGEALQKVSPVPGALAGVSGMAFATDGTVAGTFTVVDVTGLVVGARAWVSSSAPLNAEVFIADVDPVGMVVTVRPVPAPGQPPGYGGMDLSAYTVLDGARIDQADQFVA